ncbi:hypothetical protein ACRAVF_27125 [Bradyrhizobium oligotrophicum S58]
MTAVDLKIGEAKLIKKHDGWYVELFDGEGIHSVGPTDEGTARSIWNEVEAAQRRSAH